MLMSETHAGRGHAYLKIFSYVFLPMIIFGAIGWFIPGNLMGSDSNDAFIFACLPVIYFYVNLWRKGFC